MADTHASIFCANFFSRNQKSFPVYARVGDREDISNVSMRNLIREGLGIIKDLIIYIILTAGIIYMLTNCK